MAYYSCSTIGWVGYGLMVLELTGLTSLVHRRPEVFQAALLMAFYGVYFGVLSRDIADLCSDTIAQGLGVREAARARQHTREVWNGRC